MSKFSSIPKYFYAFLKITSCYWVCIFPKALSVLLLLT
jgi:hypothetical protein